ncbi:hypothetical protein [Corynebacterium lujinxingii]|uniref:Uncharacterized protein n=1 Tax=Corynebacterium lujinxingii TaxID=2763010 RepID=A0A7H0JWL3_9CORY|nr:hypothetical protein [Corynebacterium lujinxingii]MBC3178934.1 hypothetical protein [Corynebacterium lujinxingii]NNO11215.1 hypothetical protein [Corynebacterium lujinxingii]QNP89429.1 hypothetical protein IAU68_06885 [Corynebacterium lujinxingii]
MTTPDVNIDFLLPKTYVLERKGKPYAEVAYMTRVVGGGTRIPLPAGMSMVTIVATGMSAAGLRVELEGDSSFKKELVPWTFVDHETIRVWAGQISTPADNAMNLIVQARNVTTNAQNNGSVSVQIVNFPPEN